MYVKCRWVCLFLLIAVFTFSLALAETPPLYPIEFKPGSEDEAPYLVKDFGTKVEDGVRKAEVTQFVNYAFPCLPGATCHLWITLDGGKETGLPNIATSTPDLKQLPFVVEPLNGQTLKITWTVPQKWIMGDKVTLTIGAKSTPFALKLVRFKQVDGDTNGNGLGDSVEQMLKAGYPADTLLNVLRSPITPYTITQTPRFPVPELDLQTDAVFAYTTSPETIRGWKERLYTVWTMGGGREGKAYAEKNRGELQTDRHGNPLTVEGSHYLSPTANRIEIESQFYRSALLAGSDGICPEEPEYWLKAGYETAFREAWQTAYNSPWEPPHSSIDARWKAGRLMAKMQENHIRQLLRNATGVKPSIKRIIALHSPINYAQWGIVAPQHALTQLSEVQEVIGQVWTGTSRSPVRYAGIRRDLNFALAYLEYSSLYHLTRGTNKRLWFLHDPLEDDLNRSQEDYKSHYEETLVASLLFPQVNAYEVMPWPERVFGRIPATYATEVLSIMSALQDMHNQPEAKGNAVDSDDIGVFVSDSMQWQREEPQKSNYDGLWGLTLPLLQHGIPVQALSLERTLSAEYLKPFKTLLLSYDFQKPMTPETHSALATWVRSGGSLLLFGGSDPYNGVKEGWWTQKGLKSPQEDLLQQLGISIGAGSNTLARQNEGQYQFEVLERGESSEHDLKNLRRYSFDVSRWATQTGSLALKIGDVSPEDGWGAFVASVEIKVNGESALQFRTGTELESRFLAYDNNSQYNGKGRFADGQGYWIYQIDNLPKDKQITVHIEMGNGFLLSVARAVPDLTGTLQSTKVAGDLGTTFPRFRVPPAYPITYYPDFPPKESTLPSKKSEEEAERLPAAFYTLKEGGIPVWKQSVGKGMVGFVGIHAGYFSNSARSGSLLRNLAEYAHQRAGGNYNEGNALRLRRGKYFVVKSLSDAEPVEGRMVDVLSPTLAVANERTLPPNSVGLYVDLPSGSTPRIAHVAGRVQATIERNDATAFFVRGAKNTLGVARLWSGNRSFVGARAVDRLGNAVQIESFVDGSTVLLRFPNNPDGLVVRVGWN
jgi:hypothetical protein